MTVLVRSIPANAEVRSGGKLVGRTPLALSEGPGVGLTLEVFLDGYKPRAMRVVFESDRELALVLEEAPARVPGPASRARGRDDPSVLK